MTDVQRTELFSIQKSILAWFSQHKRAMPWRDHPDPYAVWVSEIMLQQTRVETVRSYFDRWMERFPTIESLAAADESEVLLAWQGLGYYSRARNLQRAARTLVLEHDGAMPSDPRELQKLPGIGPYTAGAVASIAFGVAAPAVDGNVIRVIARLARVESDVRRSAALKRIHSVAAALVDEAHPGDFNQALMELGSTVCTPRNPRCAKCPLVAHCEARAAGVQETLPMKSPPKAARVEERLAVIARAHTTGRYLVVQRPETGLLAGLWEFPLVTDDAEAATFIGTPSGIDADELTTVTHQFSHIHLTIRPLLVSVDDEFSPSMDTYVGARWLHRGDTDSVPVSSMMEKVLALV